MGAHLPGTLMDEGGSRSGASLSLRELCEENLKEGLLCRGSRRIWGGGHLSPWGPVGTQGRGPFTGNTGSWSALGMGHLSLRKVYERNLEGGLLYR